MRMGHLRFEKKKLIITTLLFVIGAGIFVFALHGASAYADCGVTNLGACYREAVGTILQNTINMLTRGIGSLMFKIVGILVVVGNYGNFIDAPVVIKGWIMVRDVMNMFFVIVLLVIAIATILQKKELAYQALLPRLIITALIINFSKTICGLLIDASQIFMLTFFGAIQSASGSNFAVLAGIPTIFSKGVNAGCGAGAVAGAVGDVFTSIFAFLWALAMVLIATFVIVILLIMLIVRIVTLWFLVILSPLAFFFIGLKQVDPKGIGKTWMDEFMKQLLFGPAVGFFLWLSLSVTQDTVDANIAKGKTDIREVNMVGAMGPGYENEMNKMKTTTALDDDCSKDETGSMSTSGIMSTLVGMGLLLGTLVVANATSNKAGQVASNYAGDVMKGKKWGFTPMSMIGKGVKEQGGRLSEKIQAKQYGVFDRAINAPRDVGNVIRRLRGKEEKPRISTRAKAQAVDLNEKQHQEEMKFRQKAQNMGSQKPDELYKNREKAKGYDRDAYNQMIVEKGLLGKPRGGDREEEEKKDAEIVKELENSLKNLPESFMKFEQKLEEVAAHLAMSLDSFKDKSGKLNESKVKAELQSGKLNVDTFFPPWININPDQLRKIATNSDKSPIERAMAVMKLQQGGHLNDSNPDDQKLVSEATDGFKGVPKLQKEFTEGLAKSNSKLHFEQNYTGVDDKGNKKAEKFFSELNVDKVSGKVLNADSVKSLMTDLGGLDILARKFLESPANKLQDTLEEMPDKKSRNEIINAMDDTAIAKAGDGTRKAIAMGSGNFAKAYKGVAGVDFAEKLQHDDKLKASYVDSKNLDTLKDGESMYHARKKGAKHEDKHLDVIRSNDDQKNALIEGLKAEIAHADTQPDSGDDKMKAQIELLKLTRNTDHVDLANVNTLLDSKFANAVNMGDLRLVEKGAGGADYDRFVEILSSKTKEQLMEFAKVAKDKENIMRDVVAKLQSQGKGEFVLALQREGAV